MSQVVGPKPQPTSAMMWTGAAFFLGGSFAALVSWAWFMWESPLPEARLAIFWVWAFLGLAGLGWPLWLLGIIDKRLIEIRELMRR